MDETQSLAGSPLWQSKKLGNNFPTSTPYPGLSPMQRNTFKLNSDIGGGTKSYSTKNLQLLSVFQIHLANPKTQAMTYSTKLGNVSVFQINRKTNIVTEMT